MQKLMYRNEKGQEITLSNSRPFLLISFENYASTSTNISMSENVQDGVIVNNVSIKEKVLPVTGDIIGYSKEDLNSKRILLTSIFNPKLEGELIYENGSLIRKVNCTVQDVSFQSPSANIQTFMIQFLCPNPYWMDLKSKKEEVALWQGSFEFDIDLGLEFTENGIELGYRESNLICNIYNDGDVDCGMKIQFKALATLKNPSLFNIDTREYIKINQILEVGDILEVTTYFDNKRIELVKNDGTRENVFNWIDLDSDFLQLSAKCDNLFRYDAEEGIDNLEVSIYYTPLYLGV